MIQNRQAFTMLELVFVIAIIGILSAIAIPKFAMTRNDALYTRGKTVLASVRNSLATERQKRILRGDFTEITSLSNGGSGAFTNFSKDGDNHVNAVLEYPEKSCTNVGCWEAADDTTYNFYHSSGSCTFILANNKLDGTCSVFGD